MSSEVTQTTTVYDLLAWLETNKKSLMMAFVAAVVIGFGIAIYRYSADQKELAASDALLKLKTTLSASQTNAQPEPSAYLKVAEEYRGTAAAERATYLAGTALFSEGKYAEAHAQFAKFLHDFGQSPFAAAAAFGSAACSEALGKTDEALAAYQNLSVRYPNASVLDDAKLGVARLYESKNQPQQALRMYDELAKPGATGSTSSEAALRRQDLLAKNPELAKTTNTTAAASSSVLSPTSTNASVALGTNLVPAKP